MRNYFKNLQIIALLTLITLISACKFPDNIPEIENINKFTLNNLKFGQTSIDEFKELTPDAIPEKVNRNVSIFNTESDNKDLYKRIRVGFRNNKLDWIEFDLNNNIEISKITELYGKPDNINTNYSKTLDYYDYNFFNIATDKQHKYVKSINIFAIPNYNQDTVVFIDSIPSLKDIVRDGFLNFKPGYTLESEFNAKYPSLSPYQKGKFGTTTVYKLETELGKNQAQYKQVSLVFNNSLLSWINLIPKDLSIQKAVTLYGSKYKINPINEKYAFYDYDNFVLTVDKAQKKVINIGIIAEKN